jgi:hypothetical protein
MITPQFPYSGSQVIITSDRLVFHSRKDGIYLFGKATIGLSSIGTINLDSKERVLIDSPKIELGHKAEQQGEQVVLGNSLVALLTELNQSLAILATALSQSDGTTLPTIKASFTGLQVAGTYLNTATNNISNMLNNVLSNTTYTT